jgi:hypothetical protein
LPSEFWNFHRSFLNVSRSVSLFWNVISSGTSPLFKIMHHLISSLIDVQHRLLLAHGWTVVQRR